MYREAALTKLFLCSFFLGLLLRDSIYVAGKIFELDADAQKNLVYLPTQEGLLSHVKQLQNLWRILQPANRSIVYASISSTHYPGVKSINICELFNLPSKISCTQEQQMKIVSTHKCLMIGPKSYWNTPARHGLPNSTKYINLREILKQECIAGYINTSGMVGFPGNIKDPRSIFLNGILSKKLLNIAQIIDSVFSSSGFAAHVSDVVVVHWRRGDQLSTRCITESSRTDKSMNCADSLQFLRFINGTLGKLGLAANSPVYIMTNEENRTIKAQIEKVGHKFLSSIRKNIEKIISKKIDTFEEFLIDLLIGCHGKAYISDGVTNIHCFMEMCRYMYAKPPYITSINEQVVRVNSVKDIPRPLKNCFLEP